jgi:hypothetical protein
MMSRTWLARREGAIVLAVLALGLLVYGYRYERLFDLRGATVPAVALLLVLGFALWDALFPAEAEVPEESRIGPIEIVILAGLSYLYLLGLVHIGVVVTTALALALCMSVLAHRIFTTGIAVSVAMAVFIWFLFERLGGTYFPRALLF